MRICTFVFLLGIMCLCTTNAQQVLGVSVLTITPTSVDTYSDTELDNYASLYYYAIADGFLWQGNSVIRSGSALGCPKADGYMSAPMLPNNSYMIQTNHWIRAYFYEVVDSTIIYEDPFGFSLISTGNAGGSDTYDPPNVYTTTYSEDYYLGSTYVGSTTNAPWIGGIRVLGSTMRGGSGYVEIYGSDLTNYWGPTSISISGGISVQTTYLSPGQVNIAYSIPLSTAAGSQSLTVTTMFGVSNPADFPVSDPPPVISGIKVNGVNSDVIPAGTSGFINIDGQFLNGATSVALSGTGVTITGFLYYSNDPNGTGRITATFQAAANATSSQTISVQTFHGNSNPTNVTVATPAMNLALVSTTISVDGRYSEDSTIQVTAVRADTGNSMPSFVGTVNIAEDGTQIYTMNGGVLPASVDLPAGGTATFVAKSLAGPQDSSTPPDSAYLKTTNYPVHGGTSLEIPQWIISGSRLDPRSTGPVYDWFQARTRDIFASATGDKYTVLAAVSSYSVHAYSDQQCGQTNWVRAAQSPIEMSPYCDGIRTDSAGPVNCGSTPTRWMTNVLLHEARHAYQASRAAASGNDQDGDFLVVNIPIAPMTIFIDTTAPRNVCNQKAGQVQSLAYHGDNLYDQAGSPDFASYAWEMDAWTFAAAHDH